MDDPQQLLLWRWSTIVQLISLAMATAFFALLARASRRAELRSWMRAWLANFLALVVTSLYWVLQPASLFPLFSALYLAAKAVFVVLLMQGVWLMTHRVERWYTTRQIATVVAIYAVIGAALCRDLVSLGILQHTVLGLTLVGFAIATWRFAATTASNGWPRALGSRVALARRIVRVWVAGGAARRRARWPGWRRRPACSCRRAPPSTPRPNG